MGRAIGQESGGGGGGGQVEIGRQRSNSILHSTNITKCHQWAREVKQTNKTKKAEIFELGIEAHGQREDFPEVKIAEIEDCRC